MEVNLKQITTETRNPNTRDIDQVSTSEILKKINNEDKTIPFVIEQAIPQITSLVDALVSSFQLGGRLIYMGAGTSGRLGVLDASECPPTYGVDKNMVIGLIAGGKDALINAVEGAEDSEELAKMDLNSIGINPNDFVVGIAASGRTPYVLSGMHYAKQKGCKTGCITTASKSKLADIVDYPIEAITGPEPITGSTRMKSGTAQKLICNMITTTSMIQLGKVYENLMIDLQPTNQKLIARMLSMIKEVTGYEEDDAKEALNRYQTVKGVILSYLTKIENEEEIQQLLSENNGNIRKAISSLKQRGYIK
ncbi:MAG: N-acetylmuramic acid 6-phosphate etherase [Prevotella sp.]|nr:N-acetylmuramic acid 6-phosphate etherase [Staphylococcus sp.]MCM1350952.1 N-acetylmuramic acid 6-phosphate etherase [Prevotella sp.]